MATFAGLNRTFRTTTEEAIGKTQDPTTGACTIKGEGDPTQADKVNLRNQLLDLNESFCDQIDELAKKDGKAREDINFLLKKQTPTQAQLDQIKDQLGKHHKELVAELKKIHEKQYDEFELAMEGNNIFDPAERLTLLTKLKDAQQTQLASLEERAVYEKNHRFNSETNWKNQRDRQFAAHVLLLAEETEAPISRHYRPSIFSSIKRGFLSDEEQRKYDVAGEVEIKRAGTFALGDTLVQDEDNPADKRWRVKSVLEKEKEKEGVTIGGRRQKSSEWDDVWMSPGEEADYLQGRKEIILTDVPAAGIYKHSLPLRALEAMKILDKPKLEIKIGPVEANKKKDIPATDNAVTCKIHSRATAEERADILNIVMHTARAKGWDDIDIGYDTPKHMWNEAYRAARRAGFPHNKIFFRGQLMTDEKLIEAGDYARKQIEDAFKLNEKTSRDTEKEEARHAGRPPRSMEEAIRKLTHIIPYDPNLEPARFFNLTPAEQNTLFAGGNLDQQAKIMADPAFDEAVLGQYMGVAIGNAPRQQQPILAATLLNSICHDNPGRAFTAFNGFPNQQWKLAVLAKVNSATAANLLMRLPMNEAVNLFGSAPFDQNSSRPLAKQEQILKAPSLSNEMIYRLYNQLSPDQKTQVLKDLAKETDGSRALGAIVANLFINSQDQGAGAVGNLKTILREVSGNQAKQDIVSAVYAALPMNMRMPPGPQQREDFSTYLRTYEATTDHSTSEIRKFYEAARERIGNEGKISDEEINAQIRGLISATLGEPQASAAFLYGSDGTNAAEIAKKLMQSNPATLAQQLNVLINEAQPENYQRLTRIIRGLGPTAVGKALTELYTHNANPDVDKLITALKGRNEHKLLANILEVCYQGSKNNLVLDAITNSIDPNDVSLSKVISHIKTPGLIANLMHGKNGVNLVSILNSLPEQADQIKVFRHLSAQQQGQVYERLSALDDQIKQKEFFEYLKEDYQRTHIENLLEKVEDDNSLPVDRTACANQIIACLSNPHLSSAQHNALMQVMTANNNYALVLEHASNPTERFVKDCLTSAQAGNNLVNAFGAIMNMASEQLRYTLGGAVASLPEQDRIDLLVNQLPQGNQNSASVQASALIHLVSQGNVSQARKLFEKIHEGDANQATAVTNKINILMQDYPDAFKEKLTQITTPPQPPAAPAPPPGQ